MDVICDSCRQVYHETTEHFDPSVPSKGKCFTLKEPFKSYGWSTFAENDDYEYGSLECPGCGVSYGNGSGFVTTRDDKGNVIESYEYSNRYRNGPELFVCSVDTCGKKCKSQAGLAAHMRSHK